MHNNLPNLFIFLDRCNNKILENSNINIGIIYRNYNDSFREIELKKIAKFRKKKRFWLFISNDIKLTLKVKADGIYIPSFNRAKRFFNYEKKNIIILGSAHNQKEIHEKMNQKCKVIFLSPIFYVNKSKNFLGMYKFNALTYTNKSNFMALGGINEKNIQKLKLFHARGFGGISLFKKKPAYKRPVFLKN